MSEPRVCTIPASEPFLDTLARAVLEGALPIAGGVPPDRLELSRWTILLPTRRAARALGEAFLRVSRDKALLLPRIRPLGDVEEDALALSAPPEVGGGDMALNLKPAIGKLDSRLALTKLVLAWSRTAAEHAADEGFRTPATPAQASSLAAQLSTLMDALDREQVSLDALDELVPDEFAEHWQKTVAFLKIVTEHWPAYLEENGVMAPYARRDALMAEETKNLRTHPPGAPVIAAGSAATVPATAALLETIAGLDNGAVVLPGLDMQLDEESWSAIAGPEPHAEHPQYGMWQFLDRLGLARDQVRVLGSGDLGRSRLLSEVMRPAGTTELWQVLLEPKAREGTKGALEGLSRIDAPTEQDEAEVISLLLRHAAEQPGKVTALVTPDRTLARRVSARLEKWNLKVDDSAGQPLDKSLPGSFLDALAEAVNSGFAPVAFLALLKHPLTLLGREPGEMRRAARFLELTALRQPAVGKGMNAFSQAARQTRELVETDKHAHPSVRRLGGKDWDAVERLLADLDKVFAPLTGLFAAAGATHPFQTLVVAHIEAGQALAAGADGSATDLWRGVAGETLHGFVVSLLDARETLEIAARDYLEIQRSLMAGLAVRPRMPAHPRIHIWGPLEARLQRPDMVVLGGLNEGTWPATIETDPWLSRPMRSKICLSPPERQIGLSAHDVAQLMGIDEVWLTRAEKGGGAPTVPSRWLLRLDAVLSALGQQDAVRADDTWLAWAGARDAAESGVPLAAPAPCPPVSARPKRLSVTRIEAWIANPYSIFAQDILKLRKLEDLAGEPDARLRGNIIHDALMRFSRDHPEKLPSDITAALMRHADTLLDAFGDDARVRTFWQGQLALFARWFATTEPGRRAGVSRVLAEVHGEINLDGFTLSAEADRIDLRDDGTLVIYDYKTGMPPPASAVDKGQAPQLPLEAVIATRGGFEGVSGAPVSRLAYVRAQGYGTGGEERDASNKIAPDVLADEVLTGLLELVADYSKESQPYRALRRSEFRYSQQYRYDAFAHLARVQEWQAAGEGED